MLAEGTVAPAISAIDQDGKTQSLAGYSGRWVLLYFYPKDDTPGCTTEACSLRNSHEDFLQAQTVVLGVSADSVASHGKFAHKFSLPFPLLADEDKEIIKAYEANGLVRRVSYLISPDGKIAKAYAKVKPAEHAAEVLQDLRDLSA